MGKRYIFRLQLFLLAVLFPIITNMQAVAYGSTATVGTLEGNLNVSPTGAASYSIPITVSPGTGGITPKLSITYNSGQGNGLLGMGFGLGGLTEIIREGQTLAQNGKVHGVNFTNDDRFALDGDQLVATSGTYGEGGTEYHTYEATFNKVVSNGQTGKGPASFTVYNKSGEIAEYGATADSAIQAQGKETIAVWALSKIRDRAGNYLTVHYLKDTENGGYYPQEIDYTGNDAAGVAPYNKVKFSYESRPDIISHYTAGSKSEINKRLKDIEVYSGSGLLYVYHFHYDQSPNTGRSRLISIQQCDGGGVCLPATTFNWQTNEEGWKGGYEYFPPSSIITDDSRDAGMRIMDLNGNGLPDLVKYRDRGSDPDDHMSWINTGDGWEEAPNFLLKRDVVNIVHQDDGSRFLDVNGDGIKDQVSSWAGCNEIWLNNGGGWSKAEYKFPTDIVWAPGLDQGTRFVQLTGDGLPDVVQYITNVAPKNIYGDHDSWTNTGNGWTEDKNFILHDPLIKAIHGEIVPVSLDAGTRLLDLNGDGLTDEVRAMEGISFTAYLNDGATWVSNPNYVLPTPIVNSEGHDLGARFVDLDGGLPDLVRSQAGGINDAWINTGAGWIEDSKFRLPTSIVDAESKDLGVRFVDLTGDGMPDLVKCGAPDDCKVWKNTGSGWEEDPAYKPVMFIVDHLGHDEGFRFLDLNGNGLPDYVYSRGNVKIAFFNKATKLPDYLIGLTNGLGEKTSITYEPLTNSSIYTKEHDASYPTQDVQKPIYVVSQTASSTDAASGNSENVTTYRYIGAKKYLRGWGFLGFHKIIKTNTASGVSETTTYGQDPAKHNVEKVLSSEIRGKGGNVLLTTENSWSVKALGGGKNGSYYFPYTATVVKKHHTLGGQLLSTQTVTTAMDEYGNPTNITDTLSGPSGTYSTNTVNSFANDSGSWILGKLAHATVTHSAPGVDSITRESGFGYDGSGFLTSSSVDGGVTTTYGRGKFGNVETQTVSGAGFGSRTTTTHYDSTGRFPEKITNAKGQSITKTYDHRFGTVKSVTDLNGITTTCDYDGFGRLISQKLPDGVVVTKSYEWSSVGLSAYVVTTHRTGAPTESVYYDALNRPVIKTLEGFNGVITEANEYDSLGRVFKKTIPYYGGTTPYYEIFSFDELGRVTNVEHPNGTNTGYSYDGFATVITNPLGQKTTKVANVRGKILSVADDAGNTTSYKYDAVGDLLQTADAEGNVSTIAYDNLGHKVAMHDPDKGNWTYSYDALGELLTQTDAKGQTTSFTYDKLGRMVSRTDPAGTSVWEYDTAAHGIGKLARVTGVAGLGGKKVKRNTLDRARLGGLDPYVRTFNYDPLSRPDATTVSINGKDYKTTTTYYGGCSKPDVVTSPDGFAVKYLYNPSGYPSGMMNNATKQKYYTINAMDAEGHVTSETHSNGMITLKNYDPKTGFLTSIDTRMSEGLALQKKLLPLTTKIKAGHKEVPSPNQSDANGQVQHISYIYDSLGNVKQRQDDVNKITDSMGYDGLNRLLSISSSTGNDVSYGYDPIGNITSKSDVGEYKYGENGAGPHAVTSITGKLAGTYQYDANGDQTSGPGRTVSYTSFSKPLEISTADSTTNFYYNANRSRFERVDSQGGNITTTLYLGSYVLVQHNDNGKLLTEEKHFVGPYAVYVKRSDGSSHTYELLRDNLGSVTGIVAEDGTVLARYYYKPYGKQIQISGGKATYPVTHQGFSGHENVDSANLIHMNGRLYDPIIGRFLSADPVMQLPYMTQGLNRYTYCIGNPLAYTDSSGYFIGEIIDAICDVVSDVVDAVCDVVSSVFDGLSEIFNSDFFVTAMNIVIGIVAMSNPITTALAVSEFVASAVATSLYSGVVCLANGGDIGDVLKTVALNFATAMVWKGTGSFLEGVGAGVQSGNWAARSVVHGVVGGGLAEVQGGDFKDGFLSAATGQVVGAMFPMPTEKDFVATIAGRTVAASVVGGTAAAITGGNFYNGAKTAAYAQLYNCAATALQLQMANGNEEQQKLALSIDKSMLDTGDRLANFAGGAIESYLKVHGAVNIDVVFPTDVIGIDLALNMNADGFQSYVGVGPTFGESEVVLSGGESWGAESYGLTAKFQMVSAANGVGGALAASYVGGKYQGSVSAGYGYGGSISGTIGYTFKRVRWHQ